MNSYKNITLDQGALKLDSLNSSNSVILAICELVSCRIEQCRGDARFMRIWAEPTLDEIATVESRARQIAGEIDDSVIWSD